MNDGADGNRCGRCGAEFRASAFLCRPCLGELKRAIGDMSSLLHEVSVLATGQTRVYRANGKPGGSDAELADLEEEYGHRVAALPAWLRSRDGRVTLPATRPVVNLDARELLYDAYDTLLGWACRLGADAISSKRVVAWLLTHADEIPFHEDAAEIHDEITYLQRRMIGAVDRSPSRIYAGPCHQPAEGGKRCQRPLYGWPGADEITCDGWRPANDLERVDGDEGCRAEHTTIDREAWMIVEFDAALLPLDDWRDALPKMLPELAWPTRSTWWRWITNGRLAAHSIDREGIELFRGGDVIDLVTAEQARIIGNRSKRRTA